MALQNIYLYIMVFCWAVFLFYWLVSAFFVKKSVTKRKWGFSLLWRVLAILIVIGFVRFSKSGAISLITFLFQSLFSFGIAGSVLTVLGLFVAVWARVCLGKNWSGYVTYKKDHELVTSGPYRFIRHPIYTGMILMFMGTVFYYGSIFIAIILLIMTINFILRIKREEAIMIKLFGKKYEDYMKRTKALIPFVL